MLARYVPADRLCNAGQRGIDRDRIGIVVVYSVSTPSWPRIILGHD